MRRRTEDAHAKDWKIANESHENVEFCRMGRVACNIIISFLWEIFQFESAWAKNVRKIQTRNKVLTCQYSMHVFGKTVNSKNFTPQIFPF